jgi:hypothetical protein
MNRATALVGSVASLLGLAAGACVGRPCQCTCVAPACAASAQASPSPAQKPAAFSAKRVLVWDGEGTGSQAKGWASCQDKAPCSATLEAKAGVGKDGSHGLEFKAKGPEWMGFGWNWFGWYPPTAGTDISKHKSLSLWIKISGEPGKKPEPHTVKVTLNGSSKGGKDETEAVALNEYEPSVADGEWHKVVVPLDPMLRGKGEGFDTFKTWSITIGAWNQGEREYVIFVDEIEFT